jgi:hypothetical protein
MVGLFVFWGEKRGLFERRGEEFLNAEFAKVTQRAQK